MLKFSYSLKKENKQPIIAEVLFYCPEDNSVFLTKRSSTVDSPNVWGVPGGHVEDNESVEEGAIRECQEEVGGLPPDSKLINIKNFNVDDKNITLYIMSVPLISKLNWKPSLNEESSDYGWFKTSSLPGNIFPSVKSIIDSLPSLKRIASYLNYLI